MSPVGQRQVFNSLGISKTFWERNEDTCCSGAPPPLVPTSYAASISTRPSERVGCLPFSLPCGYSGHFQCLLRGRWSFEAVSREGLVPPLSVVR